MVHSSRTAAQSDPAEAGFHDMPGTLFIVSTPIGNLEDVTYRALRVLREAALVAAEDTRRTAKLLTHFDIHTPTTSFHEHNEREKLPRLLERLAGGDDIALVSDAGTPGISDPGYRLVKAAAEAGVRVEAVPGASAILTALVASGLPTHAFTFAGFPPARAQQFLPDPATSATDKLNSSARLTPLPSRKFLSSVFPPSLIPTT
jgi:16S rRNA (cytidine(1402)-2'-O)-methyltransferase